MKTQLNILLGGLGSVSYTHLTLPTNREVEILVVDVTLKKKQKKKTVIKEQGRGIKNT